jgi:hypothetical protein
MNVLKHIVKKTFLVESQAKESHIHYLCLMLEITSFFVCDYSKQWINLVVS